MTRPIEIFARIGRALPLDDQVRLRAVAHDTRYNPSHIAAEDPLAAAALEKNGRWIHIARAARGELSSPAANALGLDAIAALPRDSVSSIHDFITKFPPSTLLGGMTRFVEALQTPDERKALLALETAHPFALAEIARTTSDPGELAALYAHPNIDDEALQHLARTDGASRHIILHHSKAGRHTLAVLAEDARDLHERLAISRHPHVGERTLSRLAEFAVDTRERMALLAHPKLDFAALASLANNSRNDAERTIILCHDTVEKADRPSDESTRVLKRIAAGATGRALRNTLMSHRLCTDDVLEHLAPRASHDEFNGIVRHPRIGLKTFRALEKSANTLEKRAALLQHPDVPEFVVSRLAQSSVDPTERLTILANPKLSARAIATMPGIAENQAECLAVFRHPNTDERTLTGIALFANDPATIGALSRHRNTSGTVPALLSKKASDLDRKAISVHPNANSSTLAFLAMNTQDPEVRLNILRHRCVDALVIKHLAHQEFTNDEKQVIVKNRKAPLELLSAFAKQGDVEACEAFLTRNLQMLQTHEQWFSPDALARGIGAGARMRAPETQHPQSQAYSGALNTGAVERMLHEIFRRHDNA